MTHPSVLETIAAWAASRPTFTDVARRRAQHAYVDTFACMLAGVADPATLATRAAYAHAIGNGARKPPGNSSNLGLAQVLGGGHADAAVAACVNATAAHALDYDDSFPPAITHASAILVPALVAIGQAGAASGRALIDAYLIGLEAQAIVGRGVNPAHYALGWHASSTVGCIGTAAATATLMGLDRDGIARATSVAVSMACGIKAQFGTPVKPLHIGLAARNAIEAARFAAAGMSGRLDILEAARGFRDMYAGPDAPGYSTPIAPGAPHSMDSDGLRPKRHPCCGATHNTLDALLDLKAQHDFRHDDVRSVQTVVSRTHANNLPYARPTDEMQARFSMPYCAALALAQDRLTLADFTPQAVRRAALAPLMDRIEMRRHDAQAEQAARGGRPPHHVTVVLRDGRRLCATRAHPKGSLEDPFNETDLYDKFIDCASFLPDAQRSALHERLIRLDRQDDLTFLATAFADCSRHSSALSLPPTPQRKT
jgi:2-methylcitrate dehydratase PrpD